jgi:hypothetical protein
MSPLTFASREQIRTMTSLPKRVLYASIGLAGLVILATLADIATGAVFGMDGARMWTMDVIFLICGGIVIYLAIDALAEQK